jgi:Rrf2 family iron-sulfur cluster assembly transcriptional regulator
MSMMRLALQEEGQHLALTVLAREQGVSVSSLEKLAARLRRAGLVRAARGMGGGYLLAKPASDITLADIVTALERPASDGQSGIGSAHAIWNNLSAMFHDFLDEITLADTLRGNESARLAGLTESRKGSRDRRADLSQCSPGVVS